MPQLIELPNEVLERIIESFLPDDIDNFSISCRQFYALSAAKFPKHKEMKHLYAYASCSRDGSGSFTFEHPVFLLQTLCENPHIANYIKTLWIEDYLLTKKAVETANDILEEVQAIVQSYNRLLSTEERDRWAKDFLFGFDDGYTALIAMMLPCLEKLVIEDDGALRDMHRLHKAHSRSRPLSGTMTLSKLSRVELTYGGGAFENGYADDILFYASLPSIRYLRVTGLNDVKWATLWASTEAESTLTVLILDGCEIHPQNLERIIGSTTALQEFSNRCFLPNGEGSFHIYPSCYVPDKNPEEILRSLLQFSKHSLVQLDLTDWAHKPRESIYRGLYMGSLQDFQALKNLRVEYRMFVEGIGHTVKTHRMIDLIPVSLESVTLTGPMLDRKSMAKLIEGLGEYRGWFSLVRPAKAEKIFRLEKVFYESCKSAIELWPFRWLFSYVGGVDFIVINVD